MAAGATDSRTHRSMAGIIGQRRIAEGESVTRPLSTAETLNGRNAPQRLFGPPSEERRWTKRLSRTDPLERQACSSLMRTACVLDVEPGATATALGVPVPGWPLHEARACAPTQASAMAIIERAVLTRETIGQG